MDPNRTLSKTTNFQVFLTIRLYYDDKKLTNHLRSVIRETYIVTRIRILLGYSFQTNKRILLSLRVFPIIERDPRTSISTPNLDCPTEVTGSKVGGRCYRGQSRVLSSCLSPSLSGGGR